MEDFVQNMTNLDPSLYSFAGSDGNLEYMNAILDVSANEIEDSTFQLQHFMGLCSNDDPLLIHGDGSSSIVSPRLIDSLESEDLPRNNISGFSENPVIDENMAKNSGIGGVKKTRSGKRRCKIREEEKPREVIHVRARRGQATDSHSLAERAMGMAVMLDEIINYVQSLQNQVEFLSMKLTIASSANEFSCNDGERQGRIAEEEAQVLESLAKQGYGILMNSHHPSSIFDAHLGAFSS